MLKPTFLIFVTLLSISCIKKNNITSSGGHKSFATGVINGDLISSNDEFAKSIVGLFNTKSNSICTGTLIAKNTVLTAAHCVDQEAPRTLKVIFHHDLNVVLDQMEPAEFSQVTREVINVSVHPNWLEDRPHGPAFDTGDIAIIKFSGNTPDAYTYAEFLNDESLIAVNTMVHVAGFGVNLVSTEDIKPSKSQKFQKLLEEGSIICDQNQKNCFTVEYLGDGPLRKGSAPIMSLYSTEVRLNEKGHKGTCSGDSGGPAFIFKDNKYFLFGITSRGSEFCDNTGVYTNALKYMNWIKSHLD